MPYTEIYHLANTPSDFPQVRDQKGQVFLNLAVASGAKVLVSGDNDLLAIKQTFTKLPIMTLSEFKDWLRTVNYKKTID